jgi:membrane associated rhomboid family serine protease
MFLPLSAGKRAYTGFPIGTFVIVLVNVLAFVWEEYLLYGYGDLVWFDAIQEWGLTPANLVDQVGHGALTAFTSMFLHADLGHIFFNMLYLWVFGPMIEDLTGSARFVLFYALCGVAGAALTVLLDPFSGRPGIGASGAVAGVMGSFLLLYPGRRVRTLVFVIVPLLPRLPAWLILIYWIIQQIVYAEIILLVGENFTGVGVWAHIGGFFAGLITVYFFLRKEVMFNRESALQFSRR